MYYSIIFKSSFLPSIIQYNATKLILYFCVYKLYQTADIVILLTSCYLEDVSAAYPKLFFLTR